LKVLWIKGYKRKVFFEKKLHKNLFYTISLRSSIMNCITVDRYSFDEELPTKISEHVRDGEVVPHSGAKRNEEPA
jgi:hypothetical protein